MVVVVWSFSSGTVFYCLFPLFVLAHKAMGLKLSTNISTPYGGWCQTLPLHRSRLILVYDYKI